MQAFNFMVKHYEVNIQGNDTFKVTNVIKADNFAEAYMKAESFKESFKESLSKQTIEALDITSIVACYKPL